MKRRAQWLEVKDGNAKVREIFNRHYSRRHYRDGRAPKLFVGPGEKMVLLRSNGKAIFVWRRFKTQDSQKGVNCAVFRNEGSELSSSLIVEAESLAWQRWPGARLYTYVDARKVKSRNPGFCFKKAGWEPVGVTKKLKLLILAKQPDLPPGLVAIQRKKGRIAGWAKPTVPVEIIWCGTNRPRKKFGKRKAGWSFPPAVREHLLQALQGQTCVHLFGGQADFGIRLDIDLDTNPHVVGDAYLAHRYFKKGSFDHVVLDPPYTQSHRQETDALMRVAAWIARRSVWRFSTVSLTSFPRLPLEREWLVHVGSHCAIRVLQKFTVLTPKRKPLRPEQFTRGYPLKFRRWAEKSQQQDLPLDPLPTAVPHQPVHDMGDWQ